MRVDLVQHALGDTQRHSRSLRSSQEVRESLLKLAPVTLREERKENARIQNQTASTEEMAYRPLHVRGFSQEGEQVVGVRDFAEVALESVAWCRDGVRDHLRNKLCDDL